MDIPRRLKISAIGLFDTELKVLQVAQAMLEHEEINSELIENNHEESAIVVLDYDSESGKQVFATMRESQVKLVFSSAQPINIKNTITLPKPIRVHTLKEILTQICRQLYDYIDKYEHNQTQASSSAQSGAAGKTQNIFLHLFDAKNNATILKLTHSSGANIYVNGQDKTLYVAGDSNILDAFIAAAAADINAQVLTADAFQQQVRGLSPLALDGELWRSGISCSQGQLLPGHQADVPVKLRSWPNFSRQGFKPEFFKVAAQMAKRAESLEALSRLTQVQLDVIIDFYNAAFALGLIESHQPQAAQPAQTRELSSQRKSLLGKLAQRLRMA